MRGRSIKTISFYRLKDEVDLGRVPWKSMADALRIALNCAGNFLWELLVQLSRALNPSFQLPRRDCLGSLLFIPCTHFSQQRFPCSELSVSKKPSFFPKSHNSPGQGGKHVCFTSGCSRTIPLLEQDHTGENFCSNPAWSTWSSSAKLPVPQRIWSLRAGTEAGMTLYKSIFISV